MGARAGRRRTRARAASRRAGAVLGLVLLVGAASAAPSGASADRGRAATGAGAASAVAGDRAQAVLRDAGGAERGRVTLVQDGDRVLVHVRADGLSPGFHGFHVHSTGTCTAPFTTAGAHLGAPATVVPHNAGDLPPLLVGTGGRAAASFAVERFRVAALFDADGASVIVHAGPDNFANIPARYGVVPDAQTLATGDAGARVLCGVVEPGGSPQAAGYWEVDRRGGVFAFGTAPFHGSLGAGAVTEPVVGAAVTPGGSGYWLAGRDGGVFAFGDAPFAGSAAGLALRSPIVGIATPAADAAAVVRDAAGAAVGTVRFAQEDGRVRVTAEVRGLAPGFHGFHVHATGACTAPFTSAGGHLGAPGSTVPGYAGDMVSLYADAGGVARASFVTDRYRVGELLDADGAAVIVHAGADNFANLPARYGITPDAQTLATGDAGSRVGCGVVAPVGGTPGAGYWLVAADGGVFAFGDAPFLGGLGDRRLVAPVVGIAATPSGAGYWLVAADGGVFAFGDAGYAGTGPATSRAVAAAPDGLGYWVLGADGGVFSLGDAGFAGSRGGTAAAAAFVCLLAVPSL
jgi:superoxide dismutase, Cu-Zn family